MFRFVAVGVYAQVQTYILCILALLRTEHHEDMVRRCLLKKSGRYIEAAL